jgi:hypothetical protein
MMEAWENGFALVKMTVKKGPPQKNTGRNREKFCINQE